MSPSKDILGRHDLRTTRVRTDILDIFFMQRHAMSQPDIEHRMKSHCDRVTIYRTLTTFLEKGIIHKVLDDAGAMKYALCSSFCESNSYHNHDHVHFKCTECGDTTCIEEIHIPVISLPEGFVPTETNVLMQGTCPKCE